MSEVSPFGDMSPPIVAMLRDEANLSTARHVLDDAQQDAKTRLDELKAHRPAFGFIGLKKQRDDYSSSLAALEAQLVLIESMRIRVDAARERVQPGLRAALADYLNHADPMYRQGFRASRYHEHWRRGHSLVSDRLRGFIRDLRETRKAIAADVERERARYSNDSIWHLDNVRKAAAALDREIDGLNRVSFEHAAAVAGTPFSELRLPALETLSCIQIIDTVTLRSPNDGLAETDGLLAEFAEVRQPGLETLLETFEMSAGEHAVLAEARLRQYWSSMLLQAEAHLVSDAELEPTLADIELRQAAQERRRIGDQATRPFDSER